jgi:putative ABC transport system permease protein
LNNIYRILPNPNKEFMLLYFRLLKESFTFAMNALRNNKTKNIPVIGVTIDFYYCSDSLDRKITKDLSTLDKTPFI